MGCAVRRPRGGDAILGVSVRGFAGRSRRHLGERVAGGGNKELFLYRVSLGLRGGKGWERGVRGSDKLLRFVEVLVLSELSPCAPGL